MRSVIPVARDARHGSLRHGRDGRRVRRRRRARLARCAVRRDRGARRRHAATRRPRPPAARECAGPSRAPLERRRLARTKSSTCHDNADLTMKPNAPLRRCSLATLAPSRDARAQRSRDTAVAPASRRACGAAPRRPAAPAAPPARRPAAPGAGAGAPGAPRQRRRPRRCSRTARRSATRPSLPSSRTASSSSRATRNYRVAFSLEDADLAELVRVIGELTGKRFIFGGKVRNIKATRLLAAEGDRRRGVPGVPLDPRDERPHRRPARALLKIVETPASRTQGTPMYGAGQAAPAEDRYITRIHRLAHVERRGGRRTCSATSSRRTATSPSTGRATCSSSPTPARTSAA